MINEGDGTSITHSNLVGLNGIFARISDNAETYLAKNRHGDVVYSQNDLTVTKFYDYDAFGNESNTTENDENPFRYCGEYFDTHSNTYYLRNRYYNPRVGRFTTIDPIKDGHNWYAYCGNNPLMFVDPTGLVPGDWFCSPDEAVMDFAYEYSTASEFTQLEMSSYLYKKDFGNGYALYSYTIPHIEEPHESNAYGRYDDRPSDSERAGAIHTHVTSFEFSEGDKIAARKEWLPLYLVISGQVSVIEPVYGVNNPRYVGMSDTLRQLTFAEMIALYCEFSEKWETAHNCNNEALCMEVPPFKVAGYVRNWDYLKPYVSYDYIKKILSKRFYIPDKEQ